MTSSSDFFPKTGFLRSLLMPIATLIYLVTWPDELWLLALFVVLPGTLDFIPNLHVDDKRCPESMGTEWAYEAIPVVHFILHFMNLFLTTHWVSEFGFASINIWVAFWLLVQASSLSGPTVGHELIHKKAPALRWMGRLLLSTAFYDHFFVEHIKGHHKNVGLRKDFSTARLGESYAAFLRRSVPGQFLHALEIENRRLQRYELLRRVMHNQVYHGVAITLFLVLLVFIFFGASGLLFFVVHGIIVNALSQTFNYLLHWGLSRQEGMAPTDPSLSWECNDRNILFSMLAISRHAFHHAKPNKPFYNIGYIEESPKLPGSLVVLFWLVLFDNKKFQRLMIRRLEERGRSAPEIFQDWYAQKAP